MGGWGVGPRSPSKIQIEKAGMGYNQYLLALIMLLKIETQTLMWLSSFYVHNKCYIQNHTFHKLLCIQRSKSKMFLDFNFNKEVSFIKSILSANGYPLNFLNSCVQRFRCQKTKTDSPVFGPKRKEIIIKLPFKGKEKFSKGNCVDCLQLWPHGLELLLYWMPLTNWANSPSWSANYLQWSKAD